MSYPRNGHFVDSVRSVCRVEVKALWLIVLVSSMAALLQAQPAISVKVYPSAEAGRITMGPDGALWFTETVAGKIGRITTSGVMTEYAIPTANSYPFGITTGPDGALWFTEVQSQKIGRITTDGSVTEYLAGGNPSSRFLSNIAAGSDGALWFNKHCFGISRITTAGVVTDYPTVSCPFGITSGPDGALWFADMYQVGRITTDGVITSFPTPDYAWQAITVGPDNALWFTGSVQVWPRATSPTIGRITSAGSITKYPLPSDQFFAYLIAAGPDGALWFTEAATNDNIGRISTDGTSAIIPIGAPCRYGSNQFNGIVLGIDGALWLSCNSGNIVRISVADSTAPVITMQVGPGVLWPPHGQMVPVTVSGKVADSGSGLVASSVQYAVTDEYSQVQPRGHIAVDSKGNYSFVVLLRASREGSDKDGRRYYIRVSARDKAGNRGVKWGSATVLHDRR